MTNKLYLCLVLHNHQPVGNFDFVFEEAYAHAYEPLVAALERHPGVRLTLHWSGCLRDWLHEHHPELLQRVRTLVGRKQIEPLSGGYYEPVLVALPDADKIGQLAKHNDVVQQDFGYKPRGAWLAERVWEPHLPKFLAEAGLEYTLLDDTHFTQAGFSEEDLYGYYITEEQGHQLRVFASSQDLRHALPWSPVEEVIGWLRRLAETAVPPGAPPRLVAVGEDGEKFGLWPGTHLLAWGDGKAEGWVDAFFDALERNADWLMLCTLGDATRLLPPIGRAYLPASSYEEMTVWSLPAARAQELAALKQQLQDAGRDDILRYVKGGTWRSFMAKYPEVNTLHKKIVFASKKVHQIKNPGLRAEALDHLWASQCDCPYWHGVFGGVYLFHIREAAARNQIEAETIAERALRSADSWSDAIVSDVDCDGFDEAMLSSDTQQLMVAPGQGGSIVAWDWRAARVNLINVLSRRPEAYHASLVEAAANGTLVVAGQPAPFGGPGRAAVRAKEAGLEKRLIYDWYRRASLIDHVFAPGATLDEFYRSTYQELGDFVNQPYAARTSKSRGALSLTLSRDGGVQVGGERLPLRVEKKIGVKPGVSGLTASYTLSNTGDRPIRARFGIETSWGISGGDRSEGAYAVWPGGTLKRLNEISETSSAKEVAIVYEWIGRVVVGASRAGSWWQFPIETVSNSEAGFERVYQGTSLMAHWPLELDPGQAWKVSLTFALLPSAE
jgi:alpha-amylase